MPVNMETMVQQSCDFLGTPRLNLEEWAALLRSTCGGDHEVIDPNAFAGWMRRVSVCGVAAAAIKIQCGLAGVDHGGDTYRFERTPRDVRLADADWYCALFQFAGRSELTQNDHAIQLGVGDIGLVDGARPSTRLSDNGSQWLSIYLPRQSLIFRLGFEPRACLCGRGETVAVLRSSFSKASETKNPQPGRSAPTRDSPSTICSARHLRLLTRGPDHDIRTNYLRVSAASLMTALPIRISVPTIAAETGISLRYLQKLFTERGSTCSELIFSLRLDHAARFASTSESALVQPRGWAD
jgi:AraC-like DNA-binding protein